MIWHWPQLFMAALMAMELGLFIGLSGRPKTGNHSFWCAAFGVAVNATILYYGGFWTGGIAP